MRMPTGSLFGLYRAVVTDADDPERRRRVRVRVPNVAIDTELWALPCLPVGAAGAAPAVGSTVWVLFEHGAPEDPVWIGTLP
jgi:Type VI secretion system/phage-baseplate injector OB domain